MVVLSSTFSSEKSFPGNGAPWAVILAILLVLGVEAVLHVVPRASLLRYGEGLGSYYEVHHTIAEFGPGEVSILGSSRGRESILMPTLTDLLAEETGRDVYAANYSCPDAKTSDMLLVTRQMVGENSPPSIVLYLISPRALLGDDRSIQREEIFGVFPDQFNGSVALYLGSFMERPMWNVRNVLQENYLTFRHRYRIRNLLSSLPRGRTSLSPVQGDETTWQRYVRNRSLVTHPVSDERISRYVDRLLDRDGNFVLGESRVVALNEIARLCNEAGTQLILVAAPISEDLARHMPPEVLGKYDGLLRQVASQNGITILTSEDLGLELGREDFREQSHLNRQGAEKMTRALVDQVLIPALNSPR